MLGAEWSFLNQPARLEQRAKRYLTLGPIAPQQIGRIEQLPRRSPDTSRRDSRRRAVVSFLPADGGAAARHCQDRSNAMTPGLPEHDNPCRPRHFNPAACAPAPLEGPAKQSLETSHTRLMITGALFCLAFLVIGVRLVEVAGFKGGDARRRISTSPSGRESARADIVDRNGVLLATTLDDVLALRRSEADHGPRAAHAQQARRRCCPTSRRARSTPSSPPTRASSG